MVPCPAKVPKLGAGVRAANFCQNLGDRNWRTAIVPFHQGRDALPYVILCGRVGKNSAPRMRVDVDEPRRDHHPFRIDGAHRAFRIELADGGYSVARDPDIAVVPWAAGAVDNASVGNNQVERGLLSQQKRRDQDDQAKTH
jgi:hypothetical protein